MEILFLVLITILILTLIANSTLDFYFKVKSKRTETLVASLLQRIKELEEEKQKEWGCG